MKIVYPLCFIVLSIFAISNFYQVSAQQYMFVSWDQHPFVGNDAQGFVVLVDLDEIGGGDGQDIVLLYNLDTGEFQIYPVRETADDGILTSEIIKFTSGPSSSTTGAHTFQAQIPDRVWVFSAGNLADSSSLVAASVDPQYKNKNYYAIRTTCQDYGGDDDQDGICDDWEQGTNGLRVTDLSLPGVEYVYDECIPNCPRPDHKDILVEIDWMQGQTPFNLAFSELFFAFASAPVMNPDQTPGINFHLQLTGNDEIPFKDELGWPGWDNDPVLWGFDQVKSYYFGTPEERLDPEWDQTLWKLKKKVFHYGMFIHKIKGQTTTSGTAELHGNDFVVAMGAFRQSYVQDGIRYGLLSKDQQSGTFMHELGHNLGLYHGGSPPPDHDGDGVVFPTRDVDDEELDNCKPNYPSVMSYSRQFPDFDSSRPLDYSRSMLNTLDEWSLMESNGVDSYGPSNEVNVIFGGPTGMVEYPLDTTGIPPINWDHSIPDSNPPSPVTADINFLIDPDIQTWVCPPLKGEPLAGHNDWANLKFGFEGTGEYSDGRPFGDRDLTGSPPDLINDIIVMIENLNKEVQTFPNEFFRNGNAIAGKNRLDAEFSNVIRSLQSNNIGQAMTDLNRIKQLSDGIEGGGNLPDVFSDIIIEAHFGNIFRVHVYSSVDRLMSYLSADHGFRLTPIFSEQTFQPSKTQNSLDSTKQSGIQDQFLNTIPPQNVLEEKFETLKPIEPVAAADQLKIYPGGMIFHGSEITYEQVITSRVIAASLDYTIKMFDPSDFVEPSNADDIKEKYSEEYDGVRQLIRQDNLNDAGMKLLEISKTFDGDNSNEEDLITNEAKKTILLSATQGILESYKSALDSGVTVPPTPCRPLTVLENGECVFPPGLGISFVVLAIIIGIAIYTVIRRP